MRANPSETLLSAFRIGATVTDFKPKFQKGDLVHTNSRIKKSRS